MKRVGLIFLDRPSLAEQVELARYAEERGFESAWACETRLARDAMTPLAAFAQATSRIRLATGVGDDVVDLLSAAGAPDTCRARVQEYVDAGASYPVLCPLTSNIREIIEAFAPD